MKHYDALSEAEEQALALLRKMGSIPLNSVPDRTQRDHLGIIEPGIAVYRKLDRKGLVVICEPIIDPDGFEWSAHIELV